MKRATAILAVTCLGLGSLEGCNCEPGDEPEECITLEEIQTSEVSPAGVRTVFRAADCSGEPIPDLTGEDMSIFLDDQPIQSEGNVAPVLVQEVDFELFTLLLLDMSNSIVDNGYLQPMIDAARGLVHTMLDQGHQVAVYQFAGPAYFGPVQDFTTEEGLLDDALDALSESDGLGTTDLYGSIAGAVDILENAPTPGVLSTATLVLFTDGTDEAMATTAQTAQNAVNHSDVNVFTVGLGGDVNQDELLSLGKNGFEWTESVDNLQSAFDAVTQSIQNIARSYYLVGVCSPRVGGLREMTIEVIKDDEIGHLEVNYNADGFDIVGCDPETVAQPCKDKECGEVDGFYCGTCEGTSFCNDDYQCEDACADVDCGDSMGFDCGDCSELGDTFVCQVNTCVDVCADAECDFVAGINCGDCTELYGETYYCDDTHTCQDACADAECGEIQDIDCGDCAELYSETWVCGEDNQCLDACDGKECGTWLDVDCGDCSGYGAEWGCDETGTCVEACASVECGEWYGVDCGDCSGYGDTFDCDVAGLCFDVCMDIECGDVDGFDCGDCSAWGPDWGCDQSNTCVEACTEAECGEVLGVDCGTCPTGFDCDGTNQCVPTGLVGMSWSFVPEATVTLGCTVGLDPSCDFDDETRQEVTLSGFWITDTEITVAMYQECVSDGECSTSHLGSGQSCNWGVTGRDDHPINCIDWAGLRELCQYIDGDLPTEAQWERAYRSDQDGVTSGYWIYPWGNSPDPSCARVVMTDGGDPGCGLNHTDQVKTKPTTSFDLHNMGGNVSEWTIDWYGAQIGGCGAGDCVDPDGPSTGDERIVRGGSWNDMFDSAFRTAKRNKEDPATQSPSIGGRCVKQMPAE